MAEFIYKDYSCKLTFGDKVFELPLNEQTADKISKAFDDKLLTPNMSNIEDVNAFYDSIMDAIDNLLGEGSADAIMSRFAHPGTMELLSVVNYITGEWNSQYKTSVEEMKKTAQLPSVNRETRRARR